MVSLFVVSFINTLDLLITLVNLSIHTPISSPGQLTILVLLFVPIYFLYARQRQFMNEDSLFAKAIQEKKLFISLKNKRGKFRDSNS